MSSILSPSQDRENEGESKKPKLLMTIISKIIKERLMYVVAYDATAVQMKLSKKAQTIAGLKVIKVIGDDVNGELTGVVMDSEIKSEYLLAEIRCPDGNLVFRPIDKIMIQE